MSAVPGLYVLRMTDIHTSKRALSNCSKSFSWIGHDRADNPQNCHVIIYAKLKQTKCTNLTTALLNGARLPKHEIATPSLMPKTYDQSKEICKSSDWWPHPHPIPFLHIMCSSLLNQRDVNSD